MKKCTYYKKHLLYHAAFYQQRLHRWKATSLNAFIGFYAWLTSSKFVYLHLYLFIK